MLRLFRLLFPVILNGCCFWPCANAHLLAVAEDRDCSIVDCLVSCCFGNICGVRARQLIRKKYNIAQDGEGINLIDFIAGNPQGPLGCCGIVQMIKEVEHRDPKEHKWFP